MTTTNVSSSGKYSIILPTYNERENLPICVWLLDKYLSKSNVDYEIVVVDDNSPDGTQQIVKQLQEIYGNDRVRLKARKAKLGLGTAYASGLDEAVGEFVVLMDADLSHHPKYIVDFIDKQKQADYDIVLGSRMLTGGGVAGWNLKRKVVSRGANLLADMMLQLNVTDATGSYRLYRRNVLKTLISQSVSKGYVFQVEMLARARAAGFTIAEVPIVFVDRFYGQSKLATCEIIGFLKSLMYLFFYGC